MAKKIINAQMKQRRDTKANWAATNPVLLAGELGIVSDDPNLYKVGDGTTAWNALPFRGFDGTLAHTTGDSDTAVMSQKAVTEALTELSAEIEQNKTWVYERKDVPAYTNIIRFLPSGFVIKAGSKIKNLGVKIIIAQDANLSGRIDVDTGSEIAVPYDYAYIQTMADIGDVRIVFNVITAEEISEEISEDIHKEINGILTSINLINPQEVNYGKYIYQGQLSTNTAYNTTGYIPVQEGKSYSLIAIDTYLNASARFISFFDADKVWVSDGANDIKEVVIPSGVVYIRASYDTLFWEVAQINIGNAVSYQPYKKMIDPALIDVKTLDLTFINKMSSFRGVATLGASQKIELQKNYVSRNVEVSGIIKGSIQSVEIGLGKGIFYGGYIELTPTHIYVFEGSSKVSEYEHGLTLGEKVFVSIRTAKEPNSAGNKTATIELRTQGQVFSKANIYYAGRGAAFIQNNGNSSVEVSLSFLPCYINAPIWMFGDSYYEWADKTRWIAQSIKNGNMTFLDCGLGGGTSYTLFTSFVNLLTIGLPKIAVWCLGMNDGSDTADAPSASWLSNIKIFIATCNNNNITPILATIPSVPSVNNEKKNEWVRNSGYRYIDFAKAVGATSGGQWDEGLLSADDVHPSEQGGIMLYAQALVDCPEIANS